MSRDPLGELVAGLATTPPPSRPPCAGEDPRMFDESDPDLAGPALAVCDRCPDDVRDWCAETVDPSRAKFDGVCAAQVWRAGRPVDLTLFTIGEAS